MQAGGSDGRGEGLYDQTALPPLSLKARETASLSLKRIFEHQLLQQQQQQRHPTKLTIFETSSFAIQSCTSNGVEVADEECKVMPIALMAAQADLDLDLKLAPPSTSYTKIYKQGERDMGAGHLTIFYAGTVRVYENVSTEKAQAMLLLLARGSGGDSYRANYSTISNVTAAARMKRRPPTPPLATTSGAMRPAKLFSRPQAELPLARKASLTLFLQKRKERVEEKVMVVANKLNASSIEPPPKKPCSPSTMS